MKAWDQFVDRLEVEMGGATVKQWLRPLKVAKYDAANLYLEAKNPFQIAWFEEHIRKRATASLFNNNRRPIKIHLSVANELPPKEKKSRKKQPPPEKTWSFDTLDPHSTFPLFVPSEANALPYKLLCMVCGYEEPATELGATNPIYLYGSPGSGKSHLLMALAHLMQEKGCRALYVRSDTFIASVVEAIRTNTMHQLRQACRNVDLFLLDDVHRFAGKAATQEELFHTFNTLHLKGKQIILSGQCSPSQLKKIEPRLVSRFEWGIALELTPPDETILLKILKKKTEALQFPLHHKVLNYLHQQFKSNVNLLNKALETLILRSHLSKHSSTQLSLPQAKLYLQSMLKQADEEKITPEKIFEAVACYYGVLPEDLSSKSRSRACVLPRQVALYLCREDLKLPFAAIGKIANRDHTTVMASQKLIAQKINQHDMEICSALAAIRKSL